ncbi:hypothetical protein CEXT_625011 [Caerostris extrusa]|uniref:C2H2-type domain-containing protein n=1 Tax=Caerostris extrusa TaxID=172846 RepID=A0AAV4RYW1_CAEEX|nr:hypothetical protein CEXT_625011 [Caerostris extrusa]
MRCGLSGLGEAWCQARDRRTWRGRLDALCIRLHEEPKCGCIVPNEPKINDYNMTRLFKCKRCDHISVTKKGLRFHLLIVHKEGRLFDRTLDAHGRPLNFFGDLPVEKGRKEPPKQLQTEDIEEGDEEFKRGMSIAVRESIAEAAAKGYFDSED